MRVVTSPWNKKRLKGRVVWVSVATSPSLCLYTARTLDRISVLLRGRLGLSGLGFVPRCCDVLFDEGRATASFVAQDDTRCAQTCRADSVIVMGAAGLPLFVLAVPAITRIIKSRGVLPRSAKCRGTRSTF